MATALIAGPASVSDGMTVPFRCGRDGSVLVTPGQTPDAVRALGGQRFIASSQVGASLGTTINTNPLFCVVNPPGSRVAAILRAAHAKWAAVTSGPGTFWLAQKQVTQALWGTNTASSASNLLVSGQLPGVPIPGTAECVTMGNAVTWSGANATQVMPLWTIGAFTGTDATSIQRAISTSLDSLVLMPGALAGIFFVGTSGGTYFLGMTFDEVPLEVVGAI